IDTLNENQKIIEEKQQEQQTLLSLINARKAELNIPAEMPENGNSEPVSVPAGDGAVQGSADDNSQQQTTTLAAPTFQPMQNSSDDSVLNGYIEQYNKCGMSIQACQQENIQLVEVVVNNNTEAATVQQETIEITDEELANIDNATNAIVSAADSAEGAIKEVQNLLNGQFPQLDKVTTIKLATSMTKSAICGTKSGIFAAAAAAMGVGSVFSFGSTAADAAKLTEQATASGENSALSLAKNAAGKIAQNAYTAYMQNTLGNIAETYGLNSEFTSQLLAEIGNIKSELPTTENSNQTNPIKQVKQTSTA
ncbi:MAG: hypothetical protein LUB59_03945, partial [Candidatus Gastranaerophilales bacterium]|nr:hypothetical protein [Candidatus Gastranaerophilales bacterium]